ncbi:MAG: GHKL domain-containing protein [Bacteroidia bacterium]|nr:GHKL domain-containing protein [Bacteroidia bacterium]
MLTDKPFGIRTRYALLGLGLSLVLSLLLSFFIPYAESKKMHISDFQKKLHEKEETTEKLISQVKEEIQTSDYTDLFAKHQKNYSTLYRKQGVVLMIYENDTLKFWTDNHIPVENHLLNICLDNNIVKLINGWYEVRKSTLNSKIIIGLILIKNDYSFNNEYLSNDFAVGFHLPQSTQIMENKPNEGIPIFNKENKYLFSFDKVEHEPHLWLEHLLIISLLCSLVFFWISLEKLCFRIFHRFGFYTYYIAFGALLALFQLLMIKNRFPQLLYNTELFSPSIYAHTTFIPSLGDLLFLVILLSAYLYGFYVYAKSSHKNNINGFVVIMLHVLASALIAALSINVSISLVGDSKINLNINNLISLNRYSYLAYICMGLLFTAFYFSIQILIIRLKDYQISNAKALLLWLSIMPLIAVYFNIDGYFIFIPLFWFAIQLFLYQISFIRYYTAYVITFIIMVSLITSLLVRNEINHNNEIKIKALAENLAIERDPIAEYLSIDISHKIVNDSVLINSLITNVPGDNVFLIILKEKYFNGYWEKFDIQFYAYDSLCNPINKSPGAVFDKYSFFEDLFKDRKNNNFCYLPTEKSSKSGFLLKYDLYKKSKNSNKFVAHVFIEADSKYLSDEIGFPRLLLDNTVDNQHEFSELSFAIYRNNLLSKHHGKFIYNTNLSFYNDLLQHNNTDFIYINGYKHYIMNAGSNVYVVSIKNENWVSTLTFFSYLFTIFSLLFLLLVFIINPARFDILKTFTLRNRIQLLPIAMVLIALILFGSGTVYFIIKQYEQKNAENLTERLQSVLREVEYRLGSEKNISFSSPEYLTYILARFSNVFIADINLYDNNGNLIASSKPKIIEEGLISEKMNSEAYLQMVINKQAQFINNEQIGSLNYLSAYIPFINEDNQLLGYLNIPYFGKQAELENEISTLLVTLINIYVFLIVISLLVTLFIANRITVPLHLLQQKLASMRLGRTNETIEWHNKDEIGNLITEYNRMIIELSESAERLAKSERESAWREMAKQVAHEIKNPLTPLRLNAQLIQRAYQENNPQFNEKFNKFIFMLIEQVDTLAQIATEFSNFASMPKPKLLPVIINEVIGNTITLFKTTTDTEIVYTEYAHNCEILADKEQLLRVFNNLIKNAIQAIPEDKEGRIEIVLERQNNEVVVQIKDNGIGISDEQKKMIFVPNFTTKSGGMGLGLAMVKSIMSSINGSISFNSVLHQGTTFELRFPMNTINDNQ